MSKITQVHAREILDSRGNPTVEVDVSTSSGAFARACVPSGASTGAFEANELRDGDKNRFFGKGVLKAVENVNEKIRKAVKGMEVSDQRGIDFKMLEMDGTENKSELGANAILGVSLACSKAAAAEAGKSLFLHLGGDAAVNLPVPLMNILNGGAHANNGLDVQEFMIVPTIDSSFKDNLRAGAEIFQTLKKLLDAKGHSVAVGDEGGFAPNLKSNSEALDLIAEAVDKTGYSFGGEIQLALDVASTEFYKDGKYTWEGQARSAEEIQSIYEDWSNRFPIVSIEDAFAEEDWAAWSMITKTLGGRLQLVGDDLFVTNPKRLKRGIEEKSANSLLVKVNQIGSLTETIEAVTMAQENGFTTVMSHRSGETEDDTIADLSVGLGSEQIKTGSLCRSERIAKYNQLLRIEEELGSRAEYRAKAAFSALNN